MNPIDINDVEQIMAPTRTTTTVVTFHRPFALDGFDEILPAGDYKVDTEERRLESLSFLAYQRTATILHIPSPSGNAMLDRALTIDPRDLEEALKRERDTESGQAKGAG